MLTIIKDEPMSHAFDLACDNILNQCRDLIRIVGEADYIRASNVDENDPGKSPIGDHMRHVIEFFEQFIKGVKNGNIVDYDARVRDLEVGNNPTLALRKFDEIQEALAAIYCDHTLLNRPIFSRETIVPGLPCAPAPSSVHRELVYVLGQHAVHHLEIMRRIAASFGHIFPVNFGKAPSTIQHEASVQEPCARSA